MKTPRKPKRVAAADRARGATRPPPPRGDGRAPRVLGRPHPAGSPPPRGARPPRVPA
jgi:hypothetical protein